MEYDSTVNSLSPQETKNYINHTNARNECHKEGTIARNVIIFGVDNSASHFTVNGRNAFFITESDPAQFAEDANIFLNYLHKSKF